MENKTTDLVLEFIKTAAIVIGVAIALWELVIKDRERERIVSDTTLQLIKVDLSSELIASRERSFQTIIARYDKDGHNMSIDDALEIEKVRLPQFQEFIAWEACFSARLCNEEIGLRYICNRALTHEDISKVTAVILKNDRRSENQYYKDLLNRCAQFKGPDQ